MQFLFVLQSFLNFISLFFVVVFYCGTWMVSFSFLLIVGKPALLVHVRCALIKVVH